MRLQRYLAEAGLGSRRGCEELIKAGRVTVGGEAATLGRSVDAGTEAVSVDGRLISLQTKEYWLLNKPLGVLSAVIDPRGRRTVVDCVPTTSRVFPVGRLDLNTTGVLLLTNDGELTARLLHPRYQVEKEYLATVRGNVPAQALDELRGGVALDEGRTSPAQVRAMGEETGIGTANTRLLITIHEGRKRQVRRMLEAVGYRVVALHRTRFAALSDAGLKLGQARRLTQAEVERLSSRVTRP